jgi:putative spermidine/putrescine transport system ATP-binding protein
MNARHGVAVRVEGCAKTFAVARGETVVFLRPSGCGKTTLLQIIAGLEKPELRPRRVQRHRRHWHPVEQRKVGMVFQSYALFPNLNVADDIGCGLQIRGVDRNSAGRAARS